MTERDTTQQAFIDTHCPEGFCFWGPWNRDLMDTEYFRNTYGSNPDIIIVDEYVDLNGNPNADCVTLFKRIPKDK